VDDPNNGFNPDIDHVAHDLLNAVKHRVDDELGLELLMSSNSSLGDLLEDILLSYLSSVGWLIYMWPRVEIESLSQLIKSNSLCSALKSELDVPTSSVILH
jgi:hypothetical protein